MSKIFPNKLPEYILNDYKRNAEVMVFNALKEAKLYSTQEVFYSASWLNTVIHGDAQSDGECDFIVTDSDIGIIYIEVKGGIITKDANNLWYSNGKEVKNPIEQAKKSKHVITKEFINRWNKKFPLERNPSLFRGHFVIFPNSSNRVHQDLGIFGNIKQFGFEEDIKNISKLISQFFDYIPQGHNHLNFDRLGVRGQEIFRKMLTKPLNFKPSLNKIIKNNNFEIEKLTKEQEKLLNQSIGKWKKLWVEGPAGSGKTLIALKKFVKEAINFQQSVFMCRSKNLQIKLCDSIYNNSNCIKEKIYTFDGYLLTLAKNYFSNSDIEFIQNNINDNGYTDEIREFTINGIFDISDRIKKIDLLIIDESQDFEDQWWILLDEITSKNAVIWIFGDANQKIWRNKKPEIHGISDSFYLSSILRNTHQIAKQSLVLYDGKGYGIDIKGPYSSEVNITKSRDIFEDLQIELNKLTMMKSILSNSIVILAKNDIHQKIIELSNETYQVTNDIRKNKSILVTSITNFKGLESDCILMIVDDDSKFSDDDLYIGITRARSYLNIITHETVYKNIINRLI